MTESDDELTPGSDDVRTAGSGDATTAESGGIVASYTETDRERQLRFEAGPGADAEGDSTAVVAQNLEGYAMLAVRTAVDGDELERYYGFDMALDHVAELLGVSPTDLPVPDAAADMGM